MISLTAPKDADLKKWQENLENFEEATDLAIQTLEDAGIIYQDDNGKWYSSKNGIHKISKYSPTKEGSHFL